MSIVIVILVLALVATVVALVRERERSASRSEAVARLEQERDAAAAREPQMTEVTSGLETLRTTLDRVEQSESERQRLLGEVGANVTRGNERIDAMVGRWSNPKSRSQLSEAWLVGALRRMGLRDGIHFDVQKRVQISGRRGSSEGVIDVLLRLPNADAIALDSKFPWAGHLATVLDGHDDAHEFALRKLRDALRSHIKDIARRDYQMADAADIRHVLIVVPDWQTLNLVKDVDPQIAEFADEYGVGLLPADGLFEIASALGQLHREQGWGEKIGELLGPADADRMYSACIELLDRVDCVVQRHNSAGEALKDVVATFGSSGLMARDVLKPAARAADKVELETSKEVRDLETEKVERHRKRLETARTEGEVSTRRPRAA